MAYKCTGIILMFVPAPAGCLQKTSILVVSVSRQRQICWFSLFMWAACRKQPTGGRAQQKEEDFLGFSVHSGCSQEGDFLWQNQQVEVKLLVLSLCHFFWEHNFYSLWRHFFSFHSLQSSLFCSSLHCLAVIGFFNLSLIFLRDFSYWDDWQLKRKKIPMFFILWGCSTAMM